MSDDNTEEKKHPASNRKLEKQRKDGSVAQMSDPSALFGTAGGIAALIGTGFLGWETLASSLKAAPDIFLLPFDEAREIQLNLTGSLIVSTVLPVLLGVLMVSVVLTLVMNKGVIFAMKPVTPDFKRVSMKSGFKRVFGKRGRSETLVGLIRLALWLGFATGVGWLWLPSLFNSVQCDTICMMQFAFPVASWLIFGAIVLMLIYAAMAILVQRKLFMHEQRMTDSERKRERKEQNGAPEVAKERNRRRHQDHMTSGPKVTLEATTILVVGETGVIGIAYDPPEFHLPIVTLRRRGTEEADELIHAMERLGVPAVESDELVRGCMPSTKGEMIPIKMFQLFAVAVRSVR